MMNNLFYNLPDELQILITKMNPHPCSREIWIKSHNLNMRNKLWKHTVDCQRGCYDIDMDRVNFLLSLRPEDLNSESDDE